LQILGRFSHSLTTNIEELSRGRLSRDAVEALTVNDVVFPGNPNISTPKKTKQLN
jgi:hypothetical protein